MERQKIMNNRPVLYLVAGLMCAGVAVMVAYKFLSSESGDADNLGTVRVLVATSNIAFGNELAFRDDERKGSVGFAPWPKDYLPEGAILEGEGEEQVKEQAMVAKTAFVRHQPVLMSLIQPKDEFITPDLYREVVRIDPQEVSSWQPGARADVYRVNGQEVSEFIRGALVYAVGELPTEGEEPDKRKDVAPLVHLLLPRERAEDVLKATHASKLVLRAAQQPSGNGPVFILDAMDKATEAAAKELVSVGKELEKVGEHAAACAVFEHVIRRYPDSNQRAEAEAAGLQSSQAQAEQLYQQALAARDGSDFPYCISLCKRIEKDYPEAESTVEKASILLQDATAANGEHSREKAYQRLCTDTENSLEAGDFPQVERYIDALREDFDDYVPPAPLLSPDKSIKEYEKKLKEAQTQFDLKKNVFLYYMESDEGEEALTRYEEIKDQFPAHPFVQEAERELRGKGLLE